MIFGFALFVVGYAIVYWGIHHFPNCLGAQPGTKDNCPRYSLWQLLGAGSLGIGKGTPIQLKNS
jgi:hypothetical protein